MKKAAAKAPEAKKKAKTAQKAAAAKSYVAHMGYKDPALKDACKDGPPLSKFTGLAKFRMVLHGISVAADTIQEAEKKLMERIVAKLNIRLRRRNQRLTDCAEFTRFIRIADYWEYAEGHTNMRNMQCGNLPYRLFHDVRGRDIETMYFAWTGREISLGPGSTFECESCHVAHTSTAYHKTFRVNIDELDRHDDGSETNAVLFETGSHHPILHCLEQSDIIHFCCSRACLDMCK